MEMVHEYYCWHKGQDEGDAKLVKSSSAFEAARKAMDSLKNEGSLDPRVRTLIMLVRDSEGKIHQITLEQERELRAP